jgi:hypothetical protein
MKNSSVVKIDPEIMSGTPVSPELAFQFER